MANEVPQAPRQGYAYVGCFTTERRKARGDGINVFALEAGGAAWRHVQCLDGLVNPSFLLTSRDGRFLYAVHGDLDHATACAIDPATGRLRLLNQAASGGFNGVHQALDQAGRFMVVANYASGSVAVLPVRTDGSLEDARHVLALPGQHGPHPTEQTSAHPHHVVFDPSGRFVLVPDKGLDRVFVLDFDGATGRLGVTSSLPSKPGAGPRHLAFHPHLPIVWVLNELDSTVTVCGWDGAVGALEQRQVLSTLPNGFSGQSAAAEIAVTGDGRFVYCSNRGDCSIAIFAADPATGLLTAVGWEATRGRDPRFIAIGPSGQHLLAANEQGDTIVPFRLDPASGLLTEAGDATRVKSPVTIAFSTASGGKS